jgi:hypothetical protein
LAFFITMEELEKFYPNPEHIVKMPDELRIQQRLGQIAINDSTQDELTRILSRRAGDPLNAENFVAVISEGVVEYTNMRLDQQAGDRIEYSDEYIQNEQERFLTDKMPKFIIRLLTDDQDRREVLGYWFSTVYEKIHADKPVDREKQDEFVQKHINLELGTGLSRKAKKEEKKEAERKRQEKMSSEKETQKTDLPQYSQSRRLFLLRHPHGIRPHTTARSNQHCR